MSVRFSTFGPHISKIDQQYVSKAMQPKNWYNKPYFFVEKFEYEFAKYNKRKFGVAVSNGTAALEIAIKSLNFKEGDEIIVPSFSIISTVLCVIKNGLKPVLVDSDLDNWNMDVDQVLKKINKKTKGIIITHIYGFPVNMKKILKIANKKGIYIVEDSAEMIGQKYNNKICGSFGQISTFSFYANKHITTGEGGMILTNDKKIYEKCKSLRNLCFNTVGNRFNHDDIGWNYRFTNIQAALGLGQLKNINWIIKRKIEIGKRYYKNLKSNKNIILQDLKKSYAKNIFWVYGILLKKNYKLSRDEVTKKLLESNVQTRNFFYPMHKQKIFIKKKIFSKKLQLPNSEYLANKGFYIPSGLSITNKEIDIVSDKVNKIIN